MRTEATQERVTVRIPTTVMYQFDDNHNDDQPHIYEWRGIAASGKTRQQALTNLGLRLASEFGVVIY